MFAHSQPTPCCLQFLRVLYHAFVHSPSSLAIKSVCAILIVIIFISLKVLLSILLLGKPFSVEFWQLRPSDSPVCAWFVATRHTIHGFHVCLFDSSCLMTAYSPVYVAGYSAKRVLARYRLASQHAIMDNELLVTERYALVGQSVP